MFQKFTVGNPPPVTTTPKPPPGDARRRSCSRPSARRTRSRCGARAAPALHHGVKAGTYSIVVRDRSKLHNFHLVGKGVNKKSTVAGTGTTTWKLKLAKGPLRFYSDKAPKTVKGSVTSSSRACSA